MSFKPRYILAEEAEERIVALYRKERGDAAEIFNTAIDACQSIILDMYDNAPAEVEPVKRGKWIDDCYDPMDGGAYMITVCSNCGTPNPVSNYCPNCGAKMDEGEQK